MDSPRTWGWTLLVFAAGTALLLLVAATGLGGPVAAEAGSGEVVARELLRASSTGRQALVSSLWWPPLPALLRTPLAALRPGPDGTAVSARLFGALWGGGLLALLYRMARRWDTGRAGLLLVGLLALSPVFLRAATRGATASALLFLAVLVLYGLIDWITLRDLRALSYFTIGGGLLVLASPGLALWFVGLLLVLGLLEHARPTPAAERRALILLAFAPALYAAGLWLLGNWLIMGDALYLLRGIGRLGRPAPIQPDLHTAGMFALLLGLAPAVLLLRRGRPRALPAALGLAALAAWAAASVIRGGAAELTPAARDALAAWWPVAAVGLLAAARPPRSPAIRPVGLAPLLAAATLVPAFGWFHHAARTQAPDPYAAPALHLRDSGLYDYVRDGATWPKVLVCGFAAFDLLSTGDYAPAFVPELDFDLDTALEVYGGHRLYVMIPPPRGGAALDSIHRKHPDLYHHGTPALIFDSEWQGWRLFEIIQPPRPQEGRTLSPEPSPP